LTSTASSIHVQAVNSHGAQSTSSLASWEATAADADAMRAAAEVEAVVLKLRVEEDADIHPEDVSNAESRVSKLQALLSAKQDWAESKRLMALSVKQKADIAEVSANSNSKVERQVIGAMLHEVYGILWHPDPNPDPNPLTTQGRWHAYGGHRGDGVGGKEGGFGCCLRGRPCT